MNTKGQIVPLILLIVLVGATIGFSIAGTTIKNIQETNLVEESNRAYSAAEAGIEEKLLELEQSGTATALTTPQDLSSGSQVKQVTIQQNQSLSIAKLAKDDVAQLNLDCTSCTNGTVTVTWDAGTALVITKISGNSEPYTVTRWAYNCVLSELNGFNDSTPSGGKCDEIFNVSGNTDKLMRIRTMYHDTSLTVQPSANGVIPVQSTVLTSTGKSGETERTVQVERSIPIAPAIFDYVLFSSQGSLAK